DPEAVDIADSLAHALVLPTGGDAHWSLAARALWRALLLHVASAPEFDGKRDLVSARNALLLNFLPTSGDGDGDDTPSTLERMIANPAWDGIVSAYASALITNTKPRERSGILGTAQTQTEFLDTPKLRAALRDKRTEIELDFSEWRRGVMSCFMCIPA